MIELVMSSPALWMALAGFVGLLVGSFLNVVILRLPRMLHAGWQRECRALLAGESDNHSNQPVDSPADADVSLLRPGSHCPACRAPVAWYDNIPVVSWMVLRARCRRCQAPISIRYPLVELATAVASVAVAAVLGPTLLGLCALPLTWALIALAGIDFDHQLLPDNITLPALWAGLVLSVTGSTVSPTDAIIGAAAGYLSLWLVFHVFRLLTGKEGMGYGDFKLLAVFGAWLGWQALPLVIILSSGVGAIVGGALMATGVLERGKPMPFGPYIAGAGWIALLWGDSLLGAYLRFAGLA